MREIYQEGCQSATILMMICRVSKMEQGNSVAFKVREDMQPEAGSGGRWARYWAY